jgi:metal-responsive CopG/Arc/MetJ family transcriptional regulator
MDRVMITLPSELLREVDAAAKQRGQSRSELVRHALRELLEQARRQRFEALLAEGYRESAEHAGRTASDAMPLQAAATEGVWQWDE